jgi:hypothetical protein
MYRGHRTTSVHGYTSFSSNSENRQAPQIILMDIVRLQVCQQTNLKFEIPYIRNL